MFSLLYMSFFIFFGFIHSRIFIGSPLLNYTSYLSVLLFISVPIKPVEKEKGREREPQQPPSMSAPIGRPLSPIGLRNGRP